MLPVDFRLNILLNAPKLAFLLIIFALKSQIGQNDNLTLRYALIKKKLTENMYNYNR